MTHYFTVYRDGGPRYALDGDLPARRKNGRKAGNEPKSTVRHEQAGSQPTRNVLRGRESLYRLLAENVTDVIWASDLDGNLLYISPSVERQIGYTAEEIMSHPMTVTTRKHLRNAISAALKSATAAEQGKRDKPHSYRLAVTHKDGTVVWTETCMIVLRNRRGQPVGVVGAVRDITERKKYEEALKRSESQLRLLSQRVLQVQEEERTRIARDLHDQLGQELVYLRIKAQSLAEQIGDHPEAHQSAAELVNLIDQTTSTSRRIAAAVSPPILDDMGLMRAVRLSAAEFSRRTSIPCFVDAAENLRVPKEVATAAYRILQEALTNVWKHAQASEVHVDIRKAGRTLVLRIQDNGIGLDSTLGEENSLGLLGMRERARLAGGSVTISNRRSGGVQVVARLPLDRGRAVTADTAAQPEARTDTVDTKATGGR